MQQGDTFPVQIGGINLGVAHGPGSLNASISPLLPTNDTCSTAQLIDLPSELPFSPVGQTPGPGDTMNFQLWFRDQVVSPGDSANFSDALRAIVP